MTDLFTERDKKKAKAFIKGANTGIANLLGFPVDMINYAPVLLNLLPGKQGMKPFSENPVGGSQMFKDLMAEGNVGTYKDLESIPKDEYAAGVTGMLSSEALLSLVPISQLVKGLPKGSKTIASKQEAPVVDVSKRDFLKKAPVAVAATAMVPPVLREIGEVIPASGGAKVAKKVLPSSAIIAKSRALASELSDFMVESLFKKTKKAEKLSTKQLDLKTAEYNKTLSDFLKGKKYEDLIKLSKNDLADLYNQKNFSAHKGAGDPLRSKEYGPLLDKVFKDRGIGLDSQGNYKKLLRNEGDPPPKNYLEGDNFDELMTIFEKKDKRMLPSENLIDLAPIKNNIIPEMFPSGTTAKTTSLFPNEAKKGRQLLIVSCGSTKCPDVGNMKALDRYLGPIFQSIKKAGVPENVDVAILSAKHGLIRADTPIENYDQLMTKDKVKDFVTNPNEMSKIAETMQGYDNVLVQGGDNYKNVIKSAAGDIPFTEVPKGRGIGDQRSSVTKFLTEAAGGGSTTTKKDIDTLFEAMDEEGALLEFPELGKKLNRYTFKNDRNALIEAITDEDYPAYEAAMKGMLKRTFPSGKIPVRRVENYTELQLFGTKDPETLAMMEQAGLQKLKDQKKVVTEKLIDIEDVKFVGNPAEEELIILDTPRQFRRGAMIGDKQLLSYTINLPKKVEKKAEGGIAGLSDVARDMFKGPKGIGAYQPFMVG